MNSLCGATLAYIRLNSPVPVEILKPWMFIEEPTIPTAHVSVADHPPLPNSNGTQILQAIHEPSFIDPVRQGPVLVRYDLVVAICRRQILGSGLSSNYFISALVQCICIP